MSPFPLERPVVQGHRDGFCVTDNLGVEIAVFPDWEGAKAGFGMACAALVLLSEVFAEART